MTGKKVGRLTIIERSESRIISGKKATYWKCRCECGKEKEVRGDSLRDGSVLSCGCLKDETARKLARERKKLNKYDLTGEYGIGYTSNKNDAFYFDLEDYDKIKKYTWRTVNGGYIKTEQKRGDKIETIALHRLVMNVLNDNRCIDHINHNVKDNRKCNLRIASIQENVWNSSVSKNNNSGVTGVYKSHNKWQAVIMISGKNINLGRYDKFEDAVEARLNAEKKYQGEWAYNYSINRGVVNE